MALLTMVVYSQNFKGGGMANDTAYVSAWYLAPGHS